MRRRQHACADQRCNVWRVAYALHCNTLRRIQRPGRRGRSVFGDNKSRLLSCSAGSRRVRARLGHDGRKGAVNPSTACASPSRAPSALCVPSLSSSTVAATHARAAAGRRRGAARCADREGRHCTRVARACALVQPGALNLPSTADARACAVGPPRLTPLRLLPFMLCGTAAESTEGEQPAALEQAVAAGTSRPCSGATWRGSAGACESHGAVSLAAR